MGKRAWQKREVRRTGLLPVRIDGIDARGMKITQVACTLNISERGARVVGLGGPLKVGDTVRLEHRQESGRFQVIWTRKSSSGQWEAGLRCLEQESRFWMMELCPGIEPESFRQLLKSALGEFASDSRADKKL